MKLLTDLQKEIAEINKEIWDDPNYSRLLFSEIDGLLHIYYYGGGYDDDYSVSIDKIDKEDNYPIILFLETISKISSSISHLTFRGDDEGANGTRHWDFARLVLSDSTYENLISLDVELTNSTHHNLCCISSLDDYYEEGGMIAKLVSKMPFLQELTMPSAPNHEFIDIPLNNLEYLKIQSGFDSQNFIKNLSISSNIPNLKVLDFTDFSYSIDESEYRDQYTKYSDFEALLKSNSIDNVVRFVLRNTSLCEEELVELNMIRPNLQMLIASSPKAKYVNVHKKCLQ